MNKLRLIFLSYILSVIALLLYSFTQIDLSLTISRASIIQLIEKQFQYLGFFQRPTSTIVFAIIFSCLFLLYFCFLYFAKKNLINKMHIFSLSIITFFVLFISYNAFSYDLFNYIFDAKIITTYHLNPYLHKASDFVSDPMLNFMRWTHRTYPYGPIWLLLTVPLSYLGMGLFIPTFFLFKFLAGISYLGSTFLIFKISEKLFPKDKFLNTAFWAFNPLVIIECLVSSHNDITMIFLMLWSIYLYITNKKFSSLIFYVLSIGIKFSTTVFIPIYAFLFYLNKSNKKINWETIFKIGIIFSILVLIAATIRTNFQPWYLILSFSLCSFVAKKAYVFIPSLILSITSIVVYGVYVYMTDYSKGYPQLIFNIELIGLILALVLPIIYLISKRKIKLSFD